MSLTLSILLSLCTGFACWWLGFLIASAWVETWIREAQEQRQRADDAERDAKRWREAFEAEWWAVRREHARSN